MSELTVPDNAVACPQHDRCVAFLDDLGRAHCISADDLDSDTLATFSDPHALAVIMDSLDDYAAGRFTLFDF